MWAEMFNIRHLKENLEIFFSTSFYNQHWVIKLQRVGRPVIVITLAFICYQPTVKVDLTGYFHVYQLMKSCFIAWVCLLWIDSTGLSTHTVSQRTDSGQRKAADDSQCLEGMAVLPIRSIPVTVYSPSLLNPFAENIAGICTQSFKDSCWIWKASE